MKLKIPKMFAISKNQRIFYFFQYSLLEEESKRKKEFNYTLKTFIDTLTLKNLEKPSNSDEK